MNRVGIKAGELEVVKIYLLERSLRRFDLHLRTFFRDPRARLFQGLFPKLPEICRHVDVGFEFAKLRER